MGGRYLSMRSERLVLVIRIKGITILAALLLGSHSFQPHHSANTLNEN